MLIRNVWAQSYEKKDERQTGLTYCFWCGVATYRPDHVELVLRVVAPRRAMYEHLREPLWKLGEAYRTGLLTPEQYSAAHEAFLTACGWTVDEWAAEIDRRWSRKDLKIVAPDA